MSDTRTEQEHVNDEIAADPPPGYELTADERILLAAFEREVLESGKRPVQLNVGWEVAWAILGTIQLACRHPEFVGQTRKVVEGFGRYLEKEIAIGPASAEIAARGWTDGHQVSDDALKRVDAQEAQPK